jgi:SAM-dependent methyltransferase
VTDVWSERAEDYRESEAHRSGRDLELFAEWAAGRTVLDVATGGGHVARRLRAAGCTVVTCDPAPGMKADVLCHAEHLPFADGSFDVVTCRVAAHHFEDAAGALQEMARVTGELVLVADNLFVDEAGEEADRLRDPTHVRNYSEDEWRGLFADAGLDLEQVEHEEKWVQLDPWLERAGCSGDEAARVRELLTGRIENAKLRLDRGIFKARKRR